MEEVLSKAKNDEDIWNLVAVGDPDACAAIREKYRWTGNGPLAEPPHIPLSKFLQSVGDDLTD